MFRNLASELKKQPLGSIGAIAGIISLFITLNFSSGMTSINTLSTDANLILSLIAGIGIAYSFLFCASLLIQSNKVSSVSISLIFIFLAAISSKIVFLEVYLRDAKKALSLQDYTTVVEGMGILAVVIGSAASSGLYFKYIKDTFTVEKTHNSAREDPDIHYVFPIIASVLIWLFAIYFPTSE